MVSPPQAKIGNPVNIENADAGVKPQAQTVSLQKPNTAAGASSNSAQAANTFRQNPNTTNRPPPGRDELQVYVPIQKLGFHVNRWTIKVRVSNKSDVREFNSQKLPSGKGKLMSVDLIDSDNGEIRATMFGDAVDLFGPIFEVGKVYEISKGGIKQAYKKSTSAQKSDYEITLDRNSMVRLVEDDGVIPAAAFAPTPIIEVANLPKDEVVDVLAVVYKVDNVVTVNTRNGSTTKRTVHLVDQSQGSIELTIWGDKALKFDDNFAGVLGVKGAKVSDFNVKSLTSISSTQLTTSPRIPQTEELTEWFHQLPSNFNAVPVSSSDRTVTNYPPREKKTLSQIKEEHLGSPEAFVFQTKACISFIKRDANVMYPSCPAPKCHKRVTPQNGKWQCDRCDAQFDDCEYAYMFAFVASDYTGTQWLSAFNTAEKILSIKAKELNALKEAGRNDEYDDVFSEVLFKLFNFVIRAKEDTYNGVTSVKCSVIAATPLDFVEESKSLITNIQQLLAD